MVWFPFSLASWVTSAQALFGLQVLTLSASAGPGSPQVSTFLAVTLHARGPIPKAAFWKHVSYTEGRSSRQLMIRFLCFQLHLVPASSGGPLTLPSLSEHFPFHKRGRTGLFKKKGTWSLGMPVDPAEESTPACLMALSLPLLISSVLPPKHPIPLGLSFLTCKNQKARLLRFL